MTPLEEAKNRTMQGIYEANKERDKLHWWQIKEKWKIDGVIEALVISLLMIQGLEDKYGNKKGELN